MSSAEAIHRAWVFFGLGVILLGLALIQFRAGKAFVGYGWRPSPWAYRKKEPSLFWANIIPIAAAGLFTVTLALTRLL